MSRYYFILCLCLLPWACRERTNARAPASAQPESQAVVLRPSLTVLDVDLPGRDPAGFVAELSRRLAESGCAALDWRPDQTGSLVFDGLFSDRWELFLHRATTDQAARLLLKSDVVERDLADVDVTLEMFRLAWREFQPEFRRAVDGLLAGHGEAR